MYENAINLIIMYNYDMLIKHFLEENANFVYPQCIFKEAETQWGGN